MRRDPPTVWAEALSVPRKAVVGKQSSRGSLDTPVPSTRETESTARHAPALTRPLSSEHATREPVTDSGLGLSHFQCKSR